MRSTKHLFLSIVWAGLALLVFSLFAQSARAGWAGKEVYGTAPDGTELHWVVYTPTTAGPWPAVLVIHGGGFKTGGPASGAPCALDLANAGYLAFSIEYRLAPNGSLDGQTSDGRYPQQTDDVKMAIRAARADPRCNGQVGAVGGSAGGHHTAYCAATGTIGDDRLDVGVSLSGVYDFTDFRADPNINTFIIDVTNYVGVSEFDLTDLQAASPVNFVDTKIAPLFLINSAQDTMPFSQLADMTTTLDSLGIYQYQALTLPGSLHAFDYWSLVKDQVIAFLDARFAGVPFPSPSPTPSPTPSLPPTPTPIPTASPTASPAPSPTASPAPSSTPSPTIPPPPSPTPAADPPAQLVNVSTRAHVGSDDEVMIAGFIITGGAAKTVLLRALGPSLAQSEVTGVLADPVLQLYDQAGALIAKNDNWSELALDLVDGGFGPKNANESVLVATLPAGNYTAVLSGANTTSGTALLELYDLDPASSVLSNISTRGEVASTTDPMIGGFIIDGADSAKVLVRALGPSLSARGVEGVLPDPTLELHDSDGSLIFANDNWRSDQEAQILATTIPPNDDREAAIVATLAPGSYTAIVRGSGTASGVALVEVYHLP